MMTPAQALSLYEDLQELDALRKNRIWINHLIPLLKRECDGAKGLMIDRRLPPEVRCEYVTKFNTLDELVTFLDRKEADIRKALRAYEDGGGERPQHFTKL